MAAALFVSATRSYALDVGDAAPTFQGVDDFGKNWSSADHLGKKMIAIFFYPAAMTGG